MGRRWPLTIKVKGTASSEPQGLSGPWSSPKRIRQPKKMGRRWPLTIHVQGLVRAIAIYKENQTILECWKEVTRIVRVKQYLNV